MDILPVDKNLMKEAEKYSLFREDVKNFLKKNNLLFDKFTTTDNDSKLGYISEIVLKNYLSTNFKNLISVTSWGDKFDLGRIKNIIKKENNNINRCDVVYVKEYFYDNYDIEIKSKNKKITIDVKTAETKKIPSSNWNFLYPVIQNKKTGKDIVVLCYFVKKDNKNEINLIGYMSESDISRMKIIKKGETTKFGTKSQTDNYETHLKDYKNLNEYINSI